MGEFTMPSLGADMTEGTLTEWLVQPGDHVRKGDIVAVVDTAKADIEVECFESGVVERLLVVPGTLVPVGTALAVIAPEGAETPAAPAVPPTPAAAWAPGPAAPAVPRAPVPAAPAAAPALAAPSSPLVRHLAEERGVNLAGVHGTGPGGRITRADVLAAQLATPPEAPTPTPTTAAPTGRAGGQVPSTAPAAGPLPGQAAGDRPMAPPSVPAPVPGVPPHRPRNGPAPTGAAAARTGPPRPGRVRATPLARHLAAEAGLDLARVPGTGAQGAVRAQDVRAELARPSAEAPGGAATAAPSAAAGPRAPSVPPSPAHAPAPTPAPSRAEAMRRAIGELMARSKREIPHYYLSTTVDLAAATDWLRDRNLKVPVSERLVPAALLLKAAACAAREVPQLNGFWTDGSFVPAPAVHLGVAVSLRGGGLVAPAIRDAADLPLPEIMARLRDLVARARAGRLRGSETADPTITVTSLGDQGVEAVFGVIYPPQVALVGLGKVVERPCAVDGLLGVRTVVTATLSADHRASDGATGARYLTVLDRLLQRPEEL
jgi:pyruvate dehydrogenase E2 component (dihydrolipoamide acetyltransferase)